MGKVIFGYGATFPRVVFSDCELLSLDATGTTEWP